MQAMKKTPLRIVQYVLYFKAVFWALLSLVQFVFPGAEEIFPIQSFFFLLNGIVFFCVGFSVWRAPKEIFRAAVVFLIGNVFLVLVDGFTGLDVLSMLLDVGAIITLYFYKNTNFKQIKMVG